MDRYLSGVFVNGILVMPISTETPQADIERTKESGEIVRLSNAQIKVLARSERSGASIMNLVKTWAGAHKIEVTPDNYGHLSGLYERDPEMVAIREYIALEAV